MKGIILAGGYGTRLRPLTHSTQKQLLPVGNTPVIEYVVEDMKAAGITEIGIVVGGSYPHQVKEHLGDGSRFNIDVTYIPQGEPLGLAHAVDCAKEFVDGDEFLVYFGDTMILGGIAATLASSFDPEIHSAGICVQQVDEPSRFGVIELNERNEITQILEKPTNPPTDLAYIGAIAFSANVFDVIEEIEPSWRGELELTDVLNELTNADKPLDWHRYNDVWIDVGTPEDVLLANEVILDRRQEQFESPVDVDARVEGSVEVGDDCTISEDALIHDPCSIGDGVRIGANAQIGPYVSIGDDAIIEGQLSSQAYFSMA